MKGKNETLIVNVMCTFKIKVHIVSKTPNQRHKWLPDKDKERDG